MTNPEHRTSKTASGRDSRATGPAAPGAPWLTALLLVVVLAACGCQPKSEHQGPPLKLSLGIQPAVYSGLIAIADEKGFFRESGIDLSIREYPSGVAALEAMCRREVQAATVADVAFIWKTTREPSIRVLGAIGLSNGNRIVARQDRNIRAPSDLKGKKIGFGKNTTTEYYLVSFLHANGISASEVAAVDIPPARQADALVTGEVDAMVAFDNYAYEATKRLGENAVSWPAQNNLDYHWVIAVKEDTASSPEPLKRFFRAILKAERFYVTHADESWNIVMRKWGFDPGYIDDNREKTRLSVSLNQSLITSFRNFYRWRMEKEGKTGDMPDFLNYIHTGVLDEVDPKTVTIFR